MTYQNKNKKVLVAPLSWGLGHATRCMPIIDALLAQNIDVLIASDGRALSLLQAEYPNLNFIELSGYQIDYGTNEAQFVRNMALQLPKIFKQIYQEHQELKKIITDYGVDGVISDNRYGCWSTQVPSVFLTHQIFIQLPPKMRFLENTLLALNQFFINKYTACWIPDFAEQQQSLSGTLSHLKPLDKQRYFFVGPLSRFSTSIDLATATTNVVDILVVISGPEPQRSIFEKMLIDQTMALPLAAQQNCLIVSGVTEKKATKVLSPSVSITNYLTAPELNKAILQAEVVIARAGYSTIMDLAALGKTAILVPTPAQTEQEYLANYFMEKKMFYTMPQQTFNLQVALQELPQYRGTKHLLATKETGFKNALDAFLEML